MYTDKFEFYFGQTPQYVNYGLPNQKIFWRFIKAVEIQPVQLTITDRMWDDYEKQLVKHYDWVYSTESGLQNQNGLSDSETGTEFSEPEDKTIIGRDYYGKNFYT